MSEQQSLLPCPFCGGSDVAVTEDTTHDRSCYWTYGVECQDEQCGAALNNFHRKTDAIAAWNRRSGSRPDAQAAEVPIALIEHLGDAEKRLLAYSALYARGSQPNDKPLSVALRMEASAVHDAAELLRAAPRDAQAEAQPVAWLVLFRRASGDSGWSFELFRSREDADQYLRAADDPSEWEQHVVPVRVPSQPAAAERPERRKGERRQHQQDGWIGELNDFRHGKDRRASVAVGPAPIPAVAVGASANGADACVATPPHVAEALIDELQVAVIEAAEGEHKGDWTRLNAARAALRRALGALTKEEE
jgi:Lar family restriction alleviation protein